MSRKLPDYMTKDEGSGYVYLMEAQGFHNILSLWLKRCKIGLSNNPERRLRELNSEQAPCRIIGVRYIKVTDNAVVERKLHERFKNNRKYGEWFDFWIWELPIVNQVFDQAKKNQFKVNKYQRLLIAGLLAFAIALITSSLISLTVDKPESSPTLIPNPQQTLQYRE